jgi:Xaa-Pro aminopeptidase
LHSIPYNPVFFSYAVVTPTAATLYVDKSKLLEEVKNHLTDKIAVRPYESIFGDVTALSKDAFEASDNADAKKKKFLTSNRVPSATPKLSRMRSSSRACDSATSVTAQPSASTLRGSRTS